MAGELFHYCSQPHSEVTLGYCDSEMEAADELVEDDRYLRLCFCEEEFFLLPMPCPRDLVDVACVATHLRMLSVYKTKYLTEKKKSVCLVLRLFLVGSSSKTDGPAFSQ